MTDDLRLHLSDAEHAWFDREEREANRTPSIEDRTVALAERVAVLEDRLYVRGVLLDSALELLDRRAREHARTLELVGVVERCDAILAGHTGLRLAA